MKLSKEIGIDLGTANILIYVKGEGIVVNEPSVVTINTETNKPIAVGEEARDMLGKTPGKFQAIRPLKDGVIADFQITEILLTHFINKLNFSSFQKISSKLDRVVETSKNGSANQLKESLLPTSKCMELPRASITAS